MNFRLGMITRKIRIGGFGLLLVYTVVIAVCSFTFCSIYHCQSCQISQTEKELAKKLTIAADKLAVEDNVIRKKDKETMPKHRHVDKKPSGKSGAFV